MDSNKPHLTPYHDTIRTKMILRLHVSEQKKPCNPPRVLRRRCFTWRDVSGLNNPATRLLRLSYTRFLGNVNRLRFILPFSLIASRKAYFFNNNGWEACIWRMATAPPGWHVGNRTVAVSSPVQYDGSIIVQLRAPLPFPFASPPSRRRLRWGLLSRRSFRLWVST